MVSARENGTNLDDFGFSMHLLHRMQYTGVDDLFLTQTGRELHLYFNSCFDLEESIQVVLGRFPYSDSF